MSRKTLAPGLGGHGVLPCARTTHREYWPSAGGVRRSSPRSGAHEGRYADEQAQLLGVSVDGFHAQAAFAKSLGLDATLMLADFEPKGAVARSYGVYRDERGHSARATFVIDKQGIVQHAEIPVPDELPDEDAVMAALATCNT